MRRVVRLRRLEAFANAKLVRVQRRARLLIQALDDQGRLLDVHQREVELSALTINMQSFWSNWSRAFYFSSVLGTLSNSGTPIYNTAGIKNEHDALTVAIKGKLVQSPPWNSNQEPKWFDPAVLARNLGFASVNVSANLTPMLVGAPRSFQDLRTARNYFAHRSADLRREALAIGPTYLMGSARRPSDILLFVEPKHTLSVIERWALDFRQLASALCA